MHTTRIQHVEARDAESAIYQETLSWTVSYAEARAAPPGNDLSRPNFQCAEQAAHKHLLSIFSS